MSSSRIRATSFAVIGRLSEGPLRVHVLSKKNMCRSLLPTGEDTRSSDIAPFGEPEPM